MEEEEKAVVVVVVKDSEAVGATVVVDWVPVAVEEVDWVVVE
tara:strand:+ start:835 stop:960 length:126 start_codon:yes stop_codon:yes gene_type:complete